MICMQFACYPLTITWCTFSKGTYRLSVQIEIGRESLTRASLNIRLANHGNGKRRETRDQKEFICRTA